jgi:hypothetical protein
MGRSAFLTGALLLVVGCASDGDLKRLHIVVEPGFQGRLRVVESERAERRSGPDVFLRQSGDTLIAPVGFLKDTKFWTVVELKDTSGKALSVDMDARKGVIGFRGSTTTEEGFFLIVSDGTAK